MYGFETWYFTRREERRPRVLENRVLRKVFGRKRHEVTEERRSLRTEELYNLYSILHGAVLLEKLNAFQLVKKRPAFYETRRYITAFTNACHLPLFLSQINRVHAPPSHFLKIHLNIILPATRWYPQWSPSLRFPHQNPVHASPFPNTLHMPRPFHSS